MRKFLVAIDFSESSANTVRFAFDFNKYFFAQLHFLHVFTLPYAVSAETVENIEQYDVLRKSYTDQLWNFIEEHKGDYHYDTVAHATSGGELQAIIEYTEKNGIHLLMIGDKERSGAGQWFFGTVTQSLLQKPPTDVLAIPATHRHKEWKKIWVCTDLSLPLSGEQCFKLHQLSERLQGDLEFLHITDKTEAELPSDNAAKTVILAQFGKVPIIQAMKKNIGESIDDLIEVRGGDLVIVFPHQHTWLDRLFLGSETASISKALHLPVLSMAGMER